MNASIYVVFKGGYYQVPCGSLRSVSTNIREMLGTPVDVADIRKAIKADNEFNVTAEDGEVIQVRKSLLM